MHVRAVQVEPLLGVMVQAVPVACLEPLHGAFSKRLELGVIAHERLSDEVGGARREIFLRRLRRKSDLDVRSAFCFHLLYLGKLVGQTNNKPCSATVPQASATLYSQAGPSRSAKGNTLRKPASESTIRQGDPCTLFFTGEVTVRKQAEPRNDKRAALRYHCSCIRSPGIRNCHDAE